MQDQREGLIDSQGLFVHKERIHVPFFFKKFVFILFFLAVLGLCCHMWAFSSCGEPGLLLIVVPGVLCIVVASLVEHGP